MLNDSSSNRPVDHDEQVESKNGPFSFIYKENLTQEDFEKNINHLLSINAKENDNKLLLLSIEQKSILLTIDYSVKYNNTFLIFKLLINLAQIKNYCKSKDVTYNIDFNEYILYCFMKLQELVESKNSIKSEEVLKTLSLSSIINNYEEILIIISDYLTKEINSSLSLSILSKYVQKVVNEKIYTFYIVFSIILYNLCKTFSV